MEKCLYFWLDYIEECSTLSFSANNRKVFVFLVRLYRGVFHLIDFSLMVNFSSLWGWEGDWSPTGHVAVIYVWGLVALPDTLLYIMCGNQSCCLMHCCILCVGTGHVAWCVAVYYVWELVALPDALLYIMCGNWSRCLMHCLSFADWECRWQLSVCCHQGIHECSS